MLNSCDLVRDAILKLGAERRQVVVLRFIEGMSIAEVAAALGKSESNVSVIQHRALHDLRRLLVDRQASREPRRRVTRTLRDVIVRAGGSV
jgi:RNA polymerase sigma-70 factor (ECF subfamily)